MRNIFANALKQPAANFSFSIHNLQIIIQRAVTVRARPAVTEPLECRQHF